LEHSLSAKPISAVWHFLLTLPKIGNPIRSGCRTPVESREFIRDSGNAESTGLRKPEMAVPSDEPERGIAANPPRADKRGTSFAAITGREAGRDFLGVTLPVRWPPPASSE